ncbi:uncharacterized protein LOC129753443 [Uranotaenia lowii]|uniref:uncharacterized protein LOC129753443 n=1 Tax=Uranotaenia lowii TaxID=190385 RepID=UPI00247A7030|nr:uncharacterized protein LOC129753443 [Uranotaenia lowii]
MALTATMEPYIPGSVPFSQYLEQLEFIFEHNEYTEARYKVSFLAVCGQEVYSELKKLFPGRNFRDLTYKEITEALKKRFDKSDTEILQSEEFWTRRQGDHEKAEDFILAVKVLAEKCNLGELKQRGIRDVLAIGVNDEELQKQLFNEKDLTAERAEQLILNYEHAMSRTRFLNRKKEKNINIISRLGSRPQSSFNNRAYSSKFSGGFRGRDRSLERNNFRNRSFSSRSRSGDRFSNRKRFNNEKKVFICSFCKKKGHTRKFCYQLKQNNKIYTKNQNSVKFLDTPKSPIPSTSSSIFKRLKADLESDSEDELSCLMIASGIGSKPRSNGPCYVETLIENKRLTMEVDCGSAESVISEELFFRNFKNHSLDAHYLDAPRRSHATPVLVTTPLQGSHDPGEPIAGHASSIGILIHPPQDVVGCRVWSAGGKHVGQNDEATCSNR